MAAKASIDAAAKATTDAKAATDKQKVAEAEATKLQKTDTQTSIGGGGGGAKLPDRTYVCCQGEAAVGGLNSLNEVEDGTFRKISQAYVNEVARVFDTSGLPSVVNEQSIFRSRSFVQNGVISLAKVEEAGDGVLKFTLKVPVMKKLCDDAKIVHSKAPAGNKCPLQEAVAGLSAGKPVDAGKAATIVAAAGGAKADNICANCGYGDKLLPQIPAGGKAAGMANLEADCASGKDGVEDLVIEIKFEGNTGRRRRLLQKKSTIKVKVHANAHLVLDGEYKEKLDGMCLPPIVYAPGAASILLCSKGAPLPTMTTVGGATITGARKFEVKFVVGAAEVAVTALSRRTGGFVLYPTASYLGGLFADSVDAIFAPCDGAVVAPPKESGENAAGGESVASDDGEGEGSGEGSEESQKPEAEDPPADDDKPDPPVVLDNTAVPAATLDAAPSAAAALAAAGKEVHASDLANQKTCQTIALDLKAQYVWWKRYSDKLRFGDVETHTSMNARLSCS